MADTKVVHEILIDTSKGEKNVQRAGKSLKKFGKIGGLVAVGLVTAFAKVSISEALDLEGTEAKFSTVFGAMSDDMDNFIGEFQKLSALTKSESRKIASGLQDMFVPMGFAREEATEMTKEMMHLGGAIASFNDESPQTVLDAFSGALAGNTETLRKYGIQIDQQTIKEKAVAMGLAKTTKEVTNQAKAQAIIALSYENSTDALEAFKEENLNTREQLKLAFRDLKDVSVELGAVFLPLIKDGAMLLKNFLVPALKETIGFLTNMPSVIANNEEEFAFLNATIGSLKGIFETIWETSKPILEALGQLMFDVGQDIATILNENADAITSFGNAFSDAIELMGTVIEAVFPLIKWYWDNYLKQVFSGAMIVLGALAKYWEFMFGTMNDIFTMFSGDMTVGFDEFLDYLVYAVKKINEPLLNAIRTMINIAIIQPVNGAIAILNTLIKTANRIPGINLGEIGSLQELGMFDFRNMREDTQSMYNSGSFGRSGQSQSVSVPSTPVKLYLDGYEIAEAMLPHTSRQVKLAGGNL